MAAAHTSKSAFYEFWSSREDCLRYLLERLGDDLLGAVAGEAAGASEHDERLRRGLAEFVRGCLRSRREARLLLVESVGVSGPVEELRQELQGRFARLAEVEARDRGGWPARDVDPALFARAVVGATQEATAQLIQEAEPDPDRVIRALSAIFAPSEPSI